MASEPSGTEARAAGRDDLKQAFALAYNDSLLLVAAGLVLSAGFVWLCQMPSVDAPTIEA